MADTGAEVQDAIAGPEAAAAEGVAMAEAAAAAGVAAGEAAAALGDAEAVPAYELTMAILQDGQVELIPALLALIATSIEEGVAAYLAEQVAARAAFAGVQAQAQLEFQNASATYQADVKAISDMLADYEKTGSGGA